MLTRLLGFVPSSRRNSRRYDTDLGITEQQSVIEEQHTRSLLFPDIEGYLSGTEQGLESQSFREATFLAGYPFDQDPPDVCPVRPQNIRILIARDDGFHRYVLFDSDSFSGADSGSANTPKDEHVPSPAQSASRNSPSASYFEAPLDSTQHMSSSFNSSVGDASTLLNRVRSRGASVSSSGDFGRTNRAAHEVTNLLDCAFGNITLNYLGPSTKVHMLPRNNERFHGSLDATLLISRLVLLPFTEPSSDTSQQELSGYPARQSNSNPLRNRKVVAFSILLVINLRSYKKQISRRGEPLDSPTSLRGNAFTAAELADSLSSSYSSPRQITSIEQALGTHKLRNRYDIETVETLSSFVGVHWYSLERSLTSIQGFLESSQVSRSDVEITSMPSLSNPTNASNTSERYRSGSASLPVEELELLEMADHWKSTLSQLSSIYPTLPGQNTWNKWRDETRILKQALLTQDSLVFLERLLTPFLAYHKEWTLDRLKQSAVGSKLKQYLDRNTHRPWEAASRTIIVSRTPASGRRLLYFLSLFMPYTSISRISNGSNKSSGAMSPSRSKKTAVLPEFEMREAPVERAARKSSLVQMDDPRMGSNMALSTSLPKSSNSNFDSFGSYKLSRESTNLATTSTIAQNDAIPFAQFSIRHKQSFGRDSGAILHRRAGSDASTRLTRTLQASQVVDKTSPLKRGSFRWNNAALQSSVKTPSPLSPLQPRRGSWLLGRQESSFSGLSEPSRLAETWEELPQGKAVSPNKDVQERSKIVPGHPEVADTGDSSLLGLSFSLSFDEKDGVYDVEMPQSNLDEDEAKYTGPALLSEVNSIRSDAMPLREPSGASPPVSGYLPRICSEASLQAVPPYNSLEQDIRKMMSHEPTPALAKPSSVPCEKWVDVCTSIVADADEGLIRKLRLRRLVHLEQKQNVSFGHSNTINHSMPTSRVSGSLTNMEAQPSFRSRTIREEFVEEEIKHIDPAIHNCLDELFGQPDATSRRGSVLDSTSNQSRPSSIHETHDVTRNGCQVVVMSMLEVILKNALSKFNADAEKEPRDRDETESSTPEEQENERLIQREVLNFLRMCEIWAPG